MENIFSSGTHLPILNKVNKSITILINVFNIEWEACIHIINDTFIVLQFREKK